MADRIKKREARVKNAEQQIHENSLKSKEVVAKNAATQKRIDALEKERDLYKLQAEHEANKRFFSSPRKVEKYEKAAEKTDYKVRKEQQNLIFDKYDANIKQLQSEIANAKEEISTNKNIQRILSNTIDAMDKGTLKTGRIFMEYVQ